MRNTTYHDKDICVSCEICLQCFKAIYDAQIHTVCGQKNWIILVACESSEEGKEIKMLIYFRVRETDVKILLNKDTQRPLAPMQSPLIEVAEGLYY